jgi:hypothetical protein
MGWPMCVSLLTDAPVKDLDGSTLVAVDDAQRI